MHAYETWGFSGLSNELIDILNIWAKFIYGPLLDDRVRHIAEGVSPSQYGRKEAFTVHKGLKEKGPVKVPREFVFMDRAAIGLGGVFLHLDAELNFYRLFNETIEGFDLASFRPVRPRPSAPPACRCRNKDRLAMLRFAVLCLPRFGASPMGARRCPGPRRWAGCAAASPAFNREGLVVRSGAGTAATAPT